MAKSSKGGFIGFLAFVVMLIAAVVFITSGIINAVDVKVSINGKDLVAILNTISTIALFIVVFVTAHAFVCNKAKVWQIIYWVIVIVTIVAVVLNLV